MEVFITVTVSVFDVSRVNTRVCQPRSLHGSLALVSLSSDQALLGHCPQQMTSRRYE